MYKYLFIFLTLLTMLITIPTTRSEEIDMISAEQSGLISVKFIASNEKKSRLIIHNQTNKPLSLKIPTSFAAIPVLAQINRAGFNNGGIVPQNPQRLGGGLPQNNAFGINPFAKIVVPINTVCLDFGLPTPNTRTKFKIVSIDKVSSDPKLEKLLLGLAENRIPQRIAQIAVWNINNGTSFRDISKTGFFSNLDISVAQSILINL